MARAGKVVKVLLWLVVGVVALAGLAYGFVVVRTNSELAEKVTVPVTVAEIAIPEGDPAAQARGKYLIDTLLGCNSCHGRDFGGFAEIDDPMVGKLWGPNLTSGEGSAIRDYTSADWVRAIRHGVGRDGHRLVLMPSKDYEGLSDQDLGAVVASVKAAPPVDRPDQGIRLGPLGRVLFLTGQVSFAFDEIDHARPRPHVAPAATVEYGRVLAGTCVGCHGVNYTGGPIPGGPPEWPPARNLTPDTSGIKDWTLDNFKAALRTGKRPDGTDIRAPMPWKSVGAATDEDIEAMYRFLRTVEPLPMGTR